MRLKIGQLRKVIREEVMLARRGKLREAPRKPSRGQAPPDDLKAEPFYSKNGRVCNKDECEEYGWPRGTRIRQEEDGEGGYFETEVKFPGEKDWIPMEDAEGYEMTDVTYPAAKPHLYGGEALSKLPPGTLEDLLSRAESKGYVDISYNPVAGGSVSVTFGDAQTLVMYLNSDHGWM